ncbi:LysR family transcriptional regulator [Neptunicella sp.]|uniref:LysR family transcriptional regulator n=1 Tax=Neptunicella sp. TaxID=2125986 RepID=UPI003F691650
MRPQELNLLMVFDAVMTERSITRAADRLAMTQPAVSNAVSRMRAVWKDELFVKDGRNIQPTVYAQNLWNQIKHPLGLLADAVDPREFDPATAKRSFRISMADIFVDMLWAPLRQIIEREAPGIDIHAIPYTLTNAEQLLDDARVDMVVGAINKTPSVIRSEHLMTPCYVCAMRPGHELAKANLSLKEFAAADHLLVSLSGDPTGMTDAALLQEGLTRRIACTVNHFSAVVPLLKNSNLIAVVPTATVEMAIINGELAATKAPLDIQMSQLSSLWHKRQDRDGGLIWLRKHIKNIVTADSLRHNQVMEQFLCKNKKCMAQGNKLKKAG